MNNRNKQLNKEQINKLVILIKQKYNHLNNEEVLKIIRNQFIYKKDFNYKPVTYGNIIIKG